MERREREEATHDTQLHDTQALLTFWGNIWKQKHLEEIETFLFDPRHNSRLGFGIMIRFQL
jgi:hypothetical protein